MMSTPLTFVEVVSCDGVVWLSTSSFVSCYIQDIVAGMMLYEISECTPWTTVIMVEKSGMCNRIITCNNNSFSLSPV